MDWAEFAAARQLMAEEKIGRRIREMEADEDAQYQATLKAMSKRG